MTTPPDLAALAQTVYLALDDLDGFNGAAYLRDKFAEVATLSRTAGRAEGLSEAENICDLAEDEFEDEGAIDACRTMANRISALASDPAPNTDGEELP